LSTVPGVIGHSLRGSVVTNRRIDVSGDVRVRLRCIRSMRVLRGPQSQSRRVVTDTFWEESQRVPAARLDDGGTRIPVAFALPDEIPPLSDNDALTWYRYELSVGGEVQGVDFHAAFDVPVYRTAESSQPPTPAEVALVEAALPERYVPSRTSRIHVSTLGKQVTIEFPPGRHALISLRMTVAAVVAGALTRWLFLKEDAGAFVFFPGIFATKWTIQALDLWLRASRVRARDGSISVSRGWLVPIGTRTIPASSIEDLNLKNGDQIMGIPYYDIVLETTTKGPSRIARGIRDKREGEWVMSRLVAALDQK
jgi:hypothetical protein